MKENDALCLFRGFSQSQIAKGLEAAAVQLQAANYMDTEIFSRSITDDLLDSNVGTHIEILFDSNLSEQEIMSEDYSDSAAARGVLILTSDKQRLFKIMRGIKSTSENPQDIIFASVTESALTWTFRHYFSHLSAEHEYMKTHTPEGDPDMKAEEEK
ncbi:MAG: DUF3783 domain-containing protein [Bacteroidetes bacterium]|nr:DUF3783 domain-containing protein [Bacteroidota bacterium]